MKEERKQGYNPNINYHELRFGHGRRIPDPEPDGNDPEPDGNGAQIDESDPDPNRDHSNPYEQYYDRIDDFSAYTNPYKEMLKQGTS